MTDKNDTTALDWLFAHAGPIIRWRLATDFGLAASKEEAGRLQTEALATDEVKRWLNNLGGGIHGSKDTDAENAIAKLVEYGLRAGIREFDEKLLPYANKVGDYHPSWLSDPVAAFLVAAGYSNHKSVQKWFLQRLATLHDIAHKGAKNLYLSATETAGIAKAWQGKRIYRCPYRLGESVMLPSCYDLYALAHWPHTTATLKETETIVSFVSQPEFQATRGGYLWDQSKNRCWAAGRVYLACCEPQRILLFVELAARFASARRSDWFKAALADLEGYRTEEGRYAFPREYLKEVRNSYYIYQGNHMGLGENRHKRNWLEIESTFRMLNIKRLMNMEIVPTKRCTATR